MSQYDVIVVGAGNAAFCAALSMASSRTCRCQSSGFRMVMRWVMMVVLPMVARMERLRNPGLPLPHFASASCGLQVIYPIGAAAATSVAAGLSNFMAPVRSATRAKPRFWHQASSPSMIAIMPEGLRKVR